MRLLFHVTMMILVMCASLEGVSSRKVHRCILARELQNLGWSKWYIMQFICVANMMTRFEMNVSRPIPGTTRRTVGVFQLASEKFCFDVYQSDVPNGECHKVCDAFLDEQLADDVYCASYVKWKYGFEHWPNWSKNCLNAKTTYLLNGCDL